MAPETVSKEFCIRKYTEFKETYRKIPHHREYCKFAGIDRKKLIMIYGDDAYSKLQIECGDSANKLILERTPTERIMQQYGDLTLEFGKLPPSSVWIQRGLRPGISGLIKIHGIRWSEFPLKFKVWIDERNIHNYDKVLEYINDSISKLEPSTNRRLREFQKIIEDIRRWTPARRRNTEEGYKIELRKHLEKLGYEVGEEFGESHFDLIIGKKYAVEIKKDPQQSDYDRLFGQLARHLEHQSNVVALIMDVPSQDKLNNFSALVDTYLNREGTSVEVIKK